MKRVLFCAAAAIALAACGSEEPKDVFGDMTPNPDYGCVENRSNAYDAPEAEFDTLSYVMGMNLGVSLNFQQGDFDLNHDIVIENLASTLTKAPDQDAAIAIRAKLDEFANERIRPFMMQKQFHRMVETDRPDTLPLPELYDEKYTRDEVSKWFGVDMANYVINTQMPLNVKWLVEAMRDSDNAKTFEQLDSVMRISAEQTRNPMRTYLTQELPANNLKLS